MEGFIYLHRTLLNWEWVDDPVILKVFIFCLLKANHKKNKWQGIVVERGSFITSIGKFSKELNISEMQLRNCIKKLKKSECITSKTTNKFTYISICNYNTYQTYEKQEEQANEQTNNKQITNKQQTNNKQITTNNNDNNDNNENNENNILIEKFEKFYLLYKKYCESSRIRSLKTEFEYLKQISKSNKKLNEIVLFLHNNLYSIGEMLHKQEKQYIPGLKTFLYQKKYESIEIKEPPKPIESKEKVYLSEYPKMNRNKEVAERLKIMLEQQGKELIIDCELL